MEMCCFFYFIGESCWEWMVGLDFPVLFLCFCLGNDLRSRVVSFKVQCCSQCLNISSLMPMSSLISSVTPYMIIIYVNISHLNVDAIGWGVLATIWRMSVGHVTLLHRMKKNNPIKRWALLSFLPQHWHSSWHRSSLLKLKWTVGLRSSVHLWICGCAKSPVIPKGAYQFVDERLWAKFLARHFADIRFTVSIRTIFPEYFAAWLTVIKITGEKNERQRTRERERERRVPTL